MGCNFCNDGWVQAEAGGVVRCSKCTQYIKKKFLQCTIENLQLRKGQEKASVLKTKPFLSVFLHGLYGTGKTHILASQYNSCKKEKFFLKEADFLLNSDNKTSRDITVTILQKIRDSKEFHLFIDDFGVVYSNELFSHKEILPYIYIIIDEIYERELCLSISSSRTLKELVDIFGGSIIRRINEICTFISLGKK
jgi:DNA replication protein DnaC